MRNVTRQLRIRRMLKQVAWFNLYNVYDDENARPDTDVSLGLVLQEAINNLVEEEIRKVLIDVNKYETDIKW